MKTMKGWVSGIVLSLGLGSGFISPAQAQDVGKPQRLAILEMPGAATPQGKRPKDAVLTDLLTAELSASSDFELVERESLDAILREQSLGLSSISKTEEAVRIGRLLQADWLLLLLQPAAATNAILSKLLDARTGVVLDLQMTPFLEKDRSDAAKSIARHTTTARTQTIAMKDRVWIGFGGFEDLGIYRRYQNFGEHLRTSLALKYAGSKVSVVERSHIRPLLDELQLGLNGLSEAFSAAAGRKGNLQIAKARVEAKAVSVKDAKILAADRETSVSVDLAEQTAAKSALQKAAETLAVRLLPRLVKQGE